jgi:hypothetical protein
MGELPDSIVDRFHDPKIRRKIMCDELGALLVEAVRDLPNQPFHTGTDLKRLAAQMELDVLNFCRNNHGWAERELPLKIKLAFLKGKPHVDLEGPLAYEVGIAMQDFCTLGKYMPLPGEGVDDPELDDDDDGGFVYGR